MARKTKSYQKGSVIEARNKGGTVFRLRYRKRHLEGGWIEITETLHECPNKKTAQKELAKRLEPINASNGGSVQRVEKRFSDLFTALWPNYLDKEQVKPSTRASYHSAVDKWISPFFGRVLLEDIDAFMVGDFMAKLGSARLSAKYRKNIYNLLKQLFEIAVEYDLMAASPIRPKVHRPKVDREEKSVFSVDQAKAILEAADPIYRAPMLTLAMTGIRAGELLALTWKNIDFLSKRITVTQSLWRGQLQSTKTEASDRTIGMPDQLVRILLEQRKKSKFTSPDDFVFCRADGSPIDPDSLRRDGIYPALEKAGIPFKPRASGCHAFRHLAGSIIHKETGSLKLAQKQLGHSDISTTGNIYTHVEDGEIDQTASILGKVLGESVVDLWYEGGAEGQIVQ